MNLNANKRQGGKTMNEQEKFIIWVFASLAIITAIAMILSAPSVADIEACMQSSNYTAQQCAIELNN